MSAKISDCGLYRYWLSRGQADHQHGRVAWIMCNPSTADQTTDDPTIRKVMGFTKRWGFSEALVVNVFAYRATDPAQLLKFAGDRVGPENRTYVNYAVRDAMFTVVAWGAAVPKILRPHTHTLMSYVRDVVADRDIRCLGYTKDRQPRHPLMVGYTTPLEEFRL